MITIQILERNDAVRADDWCRPLELATMSGGMSDSMSFDNPYSGRPQNNVKWVRSDAVFGTLWIGHTVKDICEKLFPYEFARGCLPPSHRLEL